MANPSFVQGAAKIAGASSTTLAFTSPNTAGNLLIAITRCGSNSAATPVVSDPNNTWIKLDAPAPLGNSVNQIWYALNCKGGANTVTLNDTSGFTTAMELLLGEYQSGVATALLALDAHHAVTGSASAPASGNCTTNFANDLLIGWTCNDAGGAITAGLIGGGTPIIRENQSQVIAYEDGNAVNNTAGLNAASFGGSQSIWTCGIAAFFQAQVATSTFSPVAGTYTSIQTVTISNVNSGLTGFAMYYTTDGSTPTTGSTLYSGPITVSTSQTIKVLAVATNYGNSNIASAAYIINLGPVVNYQVSGNAGVAGATVTYTGTKSGSVVADETGTYSIFVPAGTYTLTPSLATYTFTPASKSVTVVASNVNGVNFTAKTSASPWSEIDSRHYGQFPNSTVDVQNTQLYVVPAHPSHPPTVDSRTAGAPKDSRKTKPLNSRTPPPFES